MHFLNSKGTKHMRHKRRVDRTAGDAGPLRGMSWAKELAAAAEARVSWLWHGYVAHGNVTLLTSQWKSGKTTLVSVLLVRRRAGGTLAGQRVARGKTVVVSEEGPVHWNTRRGKLNFGNSV